MIKFSRAVLFAYCVCLISAVLLITTSLQAESVFLKDGRIIEGKITSDAEAKIIIDNGETQEIDKGDIIRTLYHNNYKNRRFITKMDGSVQEAYIVDEDNTSYTYRTRLDSRKEITILKEDVNSISKTLGSNAGKDNGKSKNKKTDMTVSEEKSLWYIGFGLGSGAGNWNVDDENITFDEWGKELSDMMTISINFGVGAILTPYLNIGLDVTALGATAKNNDKDVQRQINNYMLAATYFPFNTGFFLKGGAGISNMLIKDVDLSDSINGYGGILGTGYYFKLGETFNLGINFDMSYQKYSADSGQPGDSKFYCIYVSCYWF